MSAKVVIAIPARFASTRLPGKPLLELAGKPMVAHVIERALEFKAQLEAKVDDVLCVLATDDERIAAVGRGMHIGVCMTRADHATGTDRLAEVAQQLLLADHDIVLNLQGDEPQMPHQCLSALLDLMRTHADAAIATLCTPIESVEQFFDPNVVKVVADAHQRALYFSRAPIPFARDEFAGGISSVKTLPRDFPAYRHLGLYGYRAGALRKIAAAEKSLLERFESLEQLRALSLGLSIAITQAPMAIPVGIDTAADLARVDADMRMAVHKGQAKLRARRILFVCMGNICRSPLADAYARKRVAELGLSVDIASRGTYSGTAKQPADPRTQAIARAVGLNLSAHRATTLKSDDFYDYDLLIGHDDQNLRDMASIAPNGMESKVHNIMSFAKDASFDHVPDPYSGDHQDFIRAWELIKQGVDGLIEQLR